MAKQSQMPMKMHECMTGCVPVLLYSACFSISKQNNQNEENNFIQIILPGKIKKEWLTKI